MNLSIFAAENGNGFSIGAAEIILCDTVTKLKLAGLDIVFLLTPGHSEGSICFWIGNNFFSGDTIIPDCKTITKLRGGSEEKLKRSIELIRQKIYQGMILYPGHLNSIIINKI